MADEMSIRYEGGIEKENLNLCLEFGSFTVCIGEYELGDENGALWRYYKRVVQSFVTNLV